MAAWRESRAITSLKREVDAAHPSRSKISDGTKGDSAHAARKSDHNPDSSGVVHAWDVTKDDSLNVAQKVVDFLVKSRDSRIKYIIWEDRIMSGANGPAPWAWRDYAKVAGPGRNRHRHHAHISVNGDDGAAWGYGKSAPATWSPPPFPGTITTTSSKERVAQWRVVLGDLGYRGFKVGVYPWSGVLGLATKRFQRRHGLVADGIVGPKTWAKAIEILRAKRGKGQ